MQMGLLLMRTRVQAFSPRARYEVRVCFETDGLVGALAGGRPRFG